MLLSQSPIGTNQLGFVRLLVVVMQIDCRLILTFVVDLDFYLFAVALSGVVQYLELVIRLM